MSEQMTRQPRLANPPIALIGAPTDIGAGHRGSSMGRKPFAWPGSR